jgi:hypothetical protein
MTEKTTAATAVDPDRPSTWSKTPTWLLMPPSGTIPDPPVDTLAQVLPFAELPWEDFEQRGPATPGDRPADPEGGLRSSGQGEPTGPKIVVGAGVRVRRDRIDEVGRITLRHRSRLHHIGVGRIHKGVRVIMLVDGLDVRIVSEGGELLRHLTLDPTRDYQAQE